MRDFHFSIHSFRDRETKSFCRTTPPHEHFKHEGYHSININKFYQRILATGAVTPPAHRASRGAREDHKALARQRPLIQAEHIQKTPAIQSQPIQGPLALQSSFCRGTAKLLVLFFLQKHKDPQRRKGPPFSLYHLISSGNFPLQLVPGDYHLALKP